MSFTVKYYNRGKCYELKKYVQEHLQAQSHILRSMYSNNTLVILLQIQKNTSIRTQLYIYIYTYIYIYIGSSNKSLQYKKGE